MPKAIKLEDVSVLVLVALMLLALWCLVTDRTFGCLLFCALGGIFCVLACVGSLSTNESP